LINGTGIVTGTVNLGAVATRLERKDEPISQSVNAKGMFVTSGVPVDVDIFPKLISKIGELCSISARNKEGQRRETYEPFQERNEA
jgi:hypothetical protein